MKTFGHRRLIYSVLLQYHQRPKLKTLRLNHTTLLGCFDMTLIHERKCVQFQPPTHLNSYGGDVFQQQLAAIESQQADSWLIDMAQVEFIDSDGILALVSALSLAQRKGCRLTVCNLRPSIQMVFEITQLDQVFDILDTGIA